MIPKVKHLRVMLYLRPPTDSNKGNTHLINGINKFWCSSFCSIAELLKVDDSPNTAESPELPGWVDSLEKNNSVSENPEDDDFVLPTISYWVENHKIRDQKVDPKCIVSDIVNSDIDKISKILRNQFRSPADVLLVLSDCSVNLSENLVEQILKRFNNNWIPAFGFFKWAKLHKEYNSPDSYNSMVDILGKSKKFDLMWELIDEMDQLSGYITMVTMSKVMRRLARSGRYEDATEAFRRIGQFGLSQDVVAMNAIMDALVKEQSVEHAQDVFLQFKNHVAPNSHTFNVLIHGWCKARQFDKARKTMEDMVNHGFCPDVFSYTCFVEAYGRDKDFRKVDAILEEMGKKGCPPNAVTYTIVMHALGKAKETNEALDVYEKMKKNGCVPDSSFYSSLIYVLSEAGRLNDARDIFEDMSNRGVNPDALTYNTMIAVACKHSQEENALKLLRRMEESRCKPDLKTYHPLLKMCCRMKRIKVLSFLLSHMFKTDVSLELGTYTLLVLGLCKSGKLEHACLYFEETVLRGFVPRDSVYDMLIEELAKKGMEKAKTRIKELMVQAKEGRA